MGHQESDVRPVLLAPDTFTPPTRTPWGGERIRALKGLPAGPVVGEAWELSVEPSFPSRTAQGTPLAAVLDASPALWLGVEAAAGGTSLLVKLLDAASPLSVQIHPRDDDPALGPDESGKPEAWYVVDREAGAGLYLGFRPGTDREAVARRLDEGASLEDLLPLVPVEPGDFFVIEAGTPHCVGAGVLLVEPQRVRPGRRGLTYRYWDWNRRYDAEGREDPRGEPRALHAGRALAVTDWSRATRPDLLDGIRLRTGPCERRAPARAERLCGPAPGAGLRSDALEAWRLGGEGELALPAAGALAALTVLAGAVEVGGLRVEAGRTAAIPAGWSPRPVALDGAHALLSAVVS